MEPPPQMLQPAAFSNATHGRSQTQNTQNTSTQAHKHKHKTDDQEMASHAPVPLPPQGMGESLNEFVDEEDDKRRRGRKKEKPEASLRQRLHESWNGMVCVCVWGGVIMCRPSCRYHTHIYQLYINIHTPYMCTVGCVVQDPQHLRPPAQECAPPQPIKHSHSTQT